MTDAPQTPPPPPPAAPPTAPKKGISTLGWVAIGCIGIIVIGGLLTFACTVMVAKKAKNFVEEASDNPAMSAAEMVVRLNPNLEIVEKNEDDGTITIYDKQKNEKVTLDLDDVMSGKFGVETEDGETMNFDIGQNEDGSFGATITDEKGEVSNIAVGAEGVRVGAGAHDLPSWLPGYKGAKVSSPFSMKKDGKVSGTAVLSTPDSVAEVAEAMTKDLQAKGFDIEQTSYESAGLTSIMLSGKGPEGREVSVSINTTPKGTAVAMNFSGAN